MKPTFDEIMTYEQQYSTAPVYKEIYGDTVTPITMLQRAAKAGEQYFLLESVENGEKWGRYSFLGISPVLSAHCKDGKIKVKGQTMKEETSSKPMTVLKKMLAEYTTPKYEELPFFTGGFMGNFSYSMVQYAEPTIKLRSGEFNDFDVMLFDKVIVCDHLKQKIYVIANVKLSEGQAGYDKACQAVENMIALISQSEPQSDQEKVPFTGEFSCNLLKEEYCRMVERMKEYIVDGDIFQAVPARRFAAEYRRELLDAYRVLRTSNPSPYMFFAKMEDLEYMGTSPESLIRLDNGRLTTFPVAGTRPRGQNTEKDRELEVELLQDEKELAEHNMLVDLARNDLGRIAEYGSVKVEEYMQIHRYSKVMHIASVVAARIREDKDAFDALEVMLPAGTLSGAPKIRACQIIEELEPSARGIYGGAIGYIDFNGNMDTCIAIRMAVKKNETVYVQAGGGVVADSVPELEYEESGNKASAVIDALKRAGEVDA